MPEIPGDIMTGVLIVAGVWLVLIGATIWLFRTSAERREKTRKKLFAVYFRGIDTDSEDPEVIRNNARLYTIQRSTFIITDSMMLAGLFAIGWFFLDGSQGDKGGLALVLIATPLMATHLYAILILLVLNRRADSQHERDQLPGYNREE